MKNKICIQNRMLPSKVNELVENIGESCAALVTFKSWPVFFYISADAFRAGPYEKRGGE